MFKKVLLLIYLLFLSNSLISQLTIGLEVGTTKNFFNTGIDNLSYSTIKADWGMILNVPVHYEINNKLFLKSGISIAQKSHSIVRTGPYEGIYTSFINSYLMLPLMMGIQFGKHNLKPFGSAGIYGARWLKGKTKGRIPDILSASIEDSNQPTPTLRLTNFNADYVFNSNTDNRLEFGGAFSMGVNYIMNAHNSLNLSIDYYHALTDQQKKYMLNQSPRLNRTACVLIGYQYRF
jgi:outer membrane protein W